MGGGLYKKEEKVKCVICKIGELQPHKTTAFFEIDNTTIIFRHVPARVCENCGEKYFDEEISETLLQKASAIAKSEVELDIRDFDKIAA